MPSNGKQICVIWVSEIFSCLAGAAPQAGAAMRLKAGAAMRLKADAAEILLTFQPAHHFVIALGSQTPSGSGSREAVPQGRDGESYARGRSQG